MKNPKLIIEVVLFVIIIIAGGFYLYNNSDSDIGPEDSENGKVLNIGDVDNNSADAIDSEGDIIISELPLDIAPVSAPIPPLDGEISFNTTVPEEALTIIKKSINKNRTALQDNPNDFDKWLELGSQYKVVGDYKKALDAWGYAGVLRPNSGVSLHNIGDLYAYYIKDTEKAEQSFLDAIKNTPGEEYLYTSTYEFYKNVLKDNTKAENILKQGIDATNSQNLKNLLP